MNTYEMQSDLLKALSHAARLAILDILREGEQCVCHMEAALGLRQAYISQQLMILKQAGLLESRRDGLNLYYRVTRPEIYSIVDAVWSVSGLASGPLQHTHTKTECPCPKCNDRTTEEPLQIRLPA